MGPTWTKRTQNSCREFGRGVLKALLAIVHVKRAYKTIFRMENVFGSIPTPTSLTPGAASSLFDIHFVVDARQFRMTAPTSMRTATPSLTPDARTRRCPPQPRRRWCPLTATSTSLIFNIFC